MTQSNTVIDTHVPPLLDDNANPNPYNARKPWHKDITEKVSADAESVFFEPKPKAPVNEPVVNAPATSPEETNSQASQEHDWEKRWSDLKTLRDREKVEFKEQLDAIKEKLNTGATQVVLPETPEDVAKLEATNPDLFKTIQSIAKSLVDEGNSQVKNQLNSIEERELGLAKERARDFIKGKYPGYVDMVNSDEFEVWAKLQDEAIYNWIYKNPTNGALAVRALDLYVADTGYTDQNKGESSQAQIPAEEDASSLITTRNVEGGSDNKPKIWTQAEINALDMDEYDRLESEIDKAIMEGRVR